LSEPKRVSLRNSSRNLPMQGLRKGVLLRFARCDVVPLNPIFPPPAQDRHAGELRPIVRDAYRRTTTNSNECVEFAHYSQAGQRGISDERQALAGEVVDDRQNPKAAAVAQCMGCEVEAPTLIGGLGDCYRGPCTG